MIAPHTYGSILEASGQHPALRAVVAYAAQAERAMRRLAAGLGEVIDVGDPPPH
ncbi:hypothetical protein [Candidatus Amarolinea aalborgensis]|uniref:hypothetical protein n=1 Tax=Candidatus Amarolinea aalborgensis TaxID=2249329 RepID=UPI003BF9C10E